MAYFTKTSQNLTFTKNGIQFSETMHWRREFPPRTLRLQLAVLVTNNIPTMEYNLDKCVEFPCRYCNIDVSLPRGCKCDESGSIGTTQLETLKHNLFGEEGSFNEQFSGILFIQVLKYMVKFGVPNLGTYIRGVRRTLMKFTRHMRGTTGKL